MSNKLYIVSVMTSLDTVDADGVTVCRVTRPTPTKRKKNTDKLYALDLVRPTGIPDRLLEHFPTAPH